MSLPPSTANWHWKNKNVTSWAKSWFETELSSVSLSVPTGTLRIDKVVELDGDVELGQRKSKLITIYDFKLVLDYGVYNDEERIIKGKVTIPEVSHEITCDRLGDYQFLYDPPLDDGEITSRLPQILRELFERFPGEIIVVHGKDLTVSAPASNQPSRSATPALPAQNQKVPTAPQKAQSSKVTNTTTISTTATFQASASDLFSLLTSPDRIPTWTRAKAKSEPRVGGEYELFDGNIKGVYESLDEPKEIRQSWRLGTWPEAHTATLTTTLVQSTDSTEITLRLDNVPVGMEEEVRRGLEGYYIHGFKSIGLGSVL